MFFSQSATYSSTVPIVNTNAEAVRTMYHVTVLPGCVPPPVSLGISPSTVTRVSNPKIITFK